MIKPTKPPSPRLLALRRAAEEAKGKDDVELSGKAQARIDEQEAILLKPQPKSNGRVNGIEW